MEIKPKILKRRDVEKYVCLSCATIYKLMAEGSFPRPVKLGPQISAWRVSELNAWLERKGV